MEGGRKKVGIRLEGGWKEVGRRWKEVGRRLECGWKEVGRR